MRFPLFGFPYLYMAPIEKRGARQPWRDLHIKFSDYSLPSWTGAWLGVRHADQLWESMHKPEGM